MSTSVLAILIGALSGVVAAVCGVGGGIIMVPAFVLVLGLPQKTAVASSLAAIILTAMMATLKNHLNDLIDWRVAIPSALAGALVAWFAADGLKHLSNLTLSRIFAAVMIVVGVRMLFQK